MLEIYLAHRSELRRPEYLTRDDKGQWRKMAYNHNDFPSDLGALSADDARLAESVYQHFAAPLSGLLGK